MIKRFLNLFKPKIKGQASQVYQVSIRPSLGGHNLKYFKVEVKSTSMARAYVKAIKTAEQSLHVESALWDPELTRLVRMYSDGIVRRTKYINSKEVPYNATGYIDWEMGEINSKQLT